MKKWIVRNKILVLIIFIILLVAIIGAIYLVGNNQSSKIQEISNDNYSFKYDKTWKIKEREETTIKLLHKKSNSELNIIIKEIENEMQYKTIDEIFSNIFYNIQEQNKEYKLVNKEDLIMPQNNLKGYKLLFENSNQQVEIYIYKQGNKIVTMTYEATYDYFDLVLDSANYIMESFILNEQKFEVLTNIDLETKEITYAEETEIQNLLQEEKQEEIKNENYIVNYSFPSNFKNLEVTDKTGNYVFADLELGHNIYLKTDILHSNLYEYLDKEGNLNVYNYYNLNSYNEAKEEVNKWSEQPLCYVYKNSYSINNSINENVELVFELDEDHIFRAVISSNGVGIPKKMLEMIKINKAEDYVNE